MIDFWELTGRLLLMDPTVRNHDIYDDNTGLLPLSADGSILDGYANSATLPYPVGSYYNQLRDYFTNRYSQQNQLLLLSPVISMFALGEIGVVFFNQTCRNAFEALNGYLLNTPPLAGRSDKGSDPRFYIVLALLVVDSTTRASVGTGKFLGLDPASSADKNLLQTLANDGVFNAKANYLCFDCDWTCGSANTLRNQNYGAGRTTPFRHFRFVTP